MTVLYRIVTTIQFKKYGEHCALKQYCCYVRIRVLLVLVKCYEGSSYLYF